MVNKIYPMRGVRKLTFAWAFVIALALPGSPMAAAPAASRPVKWAESVAAPAGLPNLNRVSASLYRSAQPTREGFEYLSKKVSLRQGDRPIKTVVSLRAFNSDASDVPVGFGLRLERIRFKTWHAEDEDVVKFLRIVTTPSLQPVLVHCQHGSDRTGTMVAIYRMVCEGWTKAEAKEEMVKGGYGFHPLWQNLLGYIDQVDVNAIKAKVKQQGPWR